MDGEVDKERSRTSYNEFYRDGGWKYSFWSEYRWHRRHVVKRFRLKRGMRILEVGCGNGFHTNLLNRMGFDCTGVDLSEVGIEWARRHYPRWTFHCRDMHDMPLEPGGHDVVFTRGCSHYHYDVTSETALRSTTTLMRYLRPAGVFILVIRTDLSGRREPNNVWQNTLDDYRKHFSSFSEKWSVDWIDGMAVCALHDLPATGCEDRPQAASGEPALTT